jgi:hypothetical protein
VIFAEKAGQGSGCDKLVLAKNVHRSTRGRAPVSFWNSIVRYLSFCYFSIGSLPGSGYTLAVEVFGFVNSAKGAEDEQQATVSSERQQQLRSLRAAGLPLHKPDSKLK